MSTRISLGSLYPKDRSNCKKAVDANLERKLHGNGCALEALYLRFESGADGF